MRFDGRTVLITGAGSGLGREMAFEFADEGATVVVTDVVPERVDRVVAEVEERSDRVLGLALDVRREPAVADAVARVVQETGRLDVMVANAGVAQRGCGSVRLHEVTEADWDEVNDVNLKGVFFCFKHAALQMRHHGGGAILATSSAAALAGYPGWGAYGAGKGGVNSLVRHAAFDWSPYGIRVNAICPTHGMSPNILMAPDAEVVGLSHEEYSGRWNAEDSPIPLKIGRPPTLADNARLALFLCSDDAAYMTGLCVPACDGGTLSRVKIPFQEADDFRW
jgi:NAD(P)-dependent dehydrogenase (short-subunit alcohol dehydrogenase family)